MAKYQVLFALLAVSAALAAPAQEVAPSEDQKTEEGAALLYSAPYYSGYHDSKLVAPYTYAAAPYAYSAAPAVVPASYASVHAAQPYVQYTPSVKYVAAPAPYAYAPTHYKYAAAVAQPSAYTYSKAYGSW